MLSYRHAFHAGNYADLLKHLVLVELLRHLDAKQKPFDYIDTHAGAGLYALDSAQATKNREFEEGIGRIHRVEDPDIEAYLGVIRSYNPSGELRAYPGSPAIARALLREQDRGWLFELHPTDLPRLQKRFSTDRRFRVAGEDGFSGLLRLLPPASRRGCILIDPPYEVKQDYQRVVTTLQKAHRRFATGIYCLWYPVLADNRAEGMVQALVASGIRRIQRFELERTPKDTAVTGQPTERSGMYATGMLVINPPWTLMAGMQRLLPKLTAWLEDPYHYTWRCQELVGE